MNQPDITFDRTGIILYTLEYQKCIEFYLKIIGLPKMFETESLTCFAFGTAYLMVEYDDDHDGSQKEEARIKTCLRMNVENVKMLADRLQANNVEVDYQEHSWGTIAKFFDPDGNLCAFKDSSTFEQQIEEAD